MPRRRFHFGERSSSRQRMTDERVPTVVDRQRAESFETKRFAGRAETFSDSVTDQPAAETIRPEAADKQIGGSCSTFIAISLPCLEIIERAGVPPDASDAASAAFGFLGSDAESCSGRYSLLGDWGRSFFW